MPAIFPFPEHREFRRKLLKYRHELPQDSRNRGQFCGIPIYFPSYREICFQRPVRIRLRTPPSSPCKPRVSGKAPNRAFLRGFPATQFPDFCLCERSPILVAIFGGCLRIQKFRSRRPGSGAKSDRTCSRNSAFCAAVIQGSWVGAAIIPD